MKVIAILLVSVAIFNSALCSPYMRCKLRAILQDFQVWLHAHKFSHTCVSLHDIIRLQKLFSILCIQDQAYLQGGIRPELQKILDDNNVNYEEQDVEWAIKTDDSGLANEIQNLRPNTQFSQTHIIFLEEGNSNAGLKHIYERHQNDFKNKLDLDTEQEISHYIKCVMENSRYIPHIIKKARNNGVRVVYTISSDNYLHVVIGSNGFVVTAFPSSSPKVLLDIIMTH